MLPLLMRQRLRCRLLMQCPVTGIRSPSGCTGLVLVAKYHLASAVTTCTLRVHTLGSIPPTTETSGESITPVLQIPECTLRQNFTIGMVRYASSTSMEYKKT